MSFFDNSHLIGLEGSAGPPISFGEMVSQGFRQQFRVDSARALDDELRNRWLESLRTAQISDQISSVPDPLGRNPSIDPDDPWAYRAFAQHISGQPIDAFDPNRSLFNYDPTARIKGMINANEKIKALNNPNIKTFEQILEEVSQMQHEVEGETASMYERSGTGGWWASLLGAMGGSFTTRDPLNLITAPIGAGRTVATRIATEMGIAAGVVGYTELAEVAPARRIIGLPERDPLFNITAATLGAGIFRGAIIEPIGAGLNRLKNNRRLKADSEDIDFDLRDSQLAQMFEANSDKPSARAGAMILDDATFIERNNPFGESRAAQERFIAELQQVQRAMNGEPMTAIGRVMPPLPYEYIKKAADFEIVREQAPEVYARMEAAQARLVNLTRQVDEVTSARGVTSFVFEETRPNGHRRHSFVHVTEDGRKIEGDLTINEEVHTARLNVFGPEGRSGVFAGEESSNLFGPSVVRNVARDIKAKFPDLAEVHGLRTTGTNKSRDAAPLVSINLAKKASPKERQAANAEYQAAYREVEAEAARLNTLATYAEAAQQGEASNILAQAYGRPFVGPLLRHNNVEALVERINKINETLDDDTLARFRRETLGEGDNAVEVELWERDGGIDIGLRDPVDPDFRFVTDEGEMTVAAAMRDLQDDVDLVEAIKVCST